MLKTRTRALQTLGLAAVSLALLAGCAQAGTDGDGANQGGRSDAPSQTPEETSTPVPEGTRLIPFESADVQSETEGTVSFLVSERAVRCESFHLSVVETSNEIEISVVSTRNDPDDADCDEPMDEPEETSERITRAFTTAEPIEDRPILDGADPEIPESQQPQPDDEGGEDTIRDL